MKNEGNFLDNYEDDDDGIITDLAEYSTKGGFDKATIVAEQMRACLKARSQELKDGFATLWMNPKSGKVEKVDLPDPRQVYFSSVTAMQIALYPEITKTKEIKLKLDQFKEACDKLKEKYIYTELQPNEGKLILTGRKFMPQKGQEVWYGFAKVSGKPPQPTTMKWDYYTNLYIDELIPIYDEWFSNLSLLCDTLNYFKAGEQY